MAEKPSGRIVKPRFASIPEWVVRHPAVLGSPTALVAYAHLHILSDFQTRITAADWKEVSDMTGYSKRTVMRAMGTLREAGAVEKRGHDLYLPMHDPGAISGTETDSECQICPILVPNLAIAPLSTENSEVIEALNELLATRYSSFAGTPLVNHQTKKWQTDMRLLLERGPSSWAKPKAIEPERVQRRINGIFDNLATPQGDRGFCWAAVIRSPGKLRQQWDQITAAANKGKAKVPATSNPQDFPYEPGMPGFDLASRG